MSEAPCLHCALAETANAHIAAGHHACLRTILGSLMEVAADQIALAPADQQGALIDMTVDLFVTNIRNSREKVRQGKVQG